MKYAYRRLVAGLLVIPAVAIAWVSFYATLVGLGAEPTASVGQVFTDGLMFGLLVEILFVANAVAKEKIRRQKTK
jgi:hypothetical protein